MKALFHQERGPHLATNHGDHDVEPSGVQCFEESKSFEGC